MMNMTVNAVGRSMTDPNMRLVEVVTTEILSVYLKIDAYSQACAETFRWEGDLGPTAYPCWWLSRLYVPQQHRGIGLASIALDRLLDLADRYDRKLVLSAVPQPPFTDKTLRAFYLRHGFKQQTAVPVLLYEPNTRAQHTPGAIYATCSP